eukprot:m.260636 g.260636  ORF g.260636 m.260636 type:complete len:125 (-) comp23813_c0_seq1:58-432(-)
MSCQAVDPCVSPAGQPQFLTMSESDIPPAPSSPPAPAPTATTRVPPPPGSSKCRACKEYLPQERFSTTQRARLRRGKIWNMICTGCEGSKRAVAGNAYHDTYDALLECVRNGDVTADRFGTYWR